MKNHATAVLAALLLGSGCVAKTPVTVQQERAETALAELGSAPVPAVKTTLPEQKYATVKESCVLQSEHRDADQDQLKMILMEQVKRDAVEELFGTMLKSRTEVVDGRLVSDKVKQVAVGSVRIKGKPTFYNGKNWGEVCTKAEAYITEEDFQRYQPKTVVLDNFCYNNPEASLKSLKEDAYGAAYKKVITKFRPSMKDISTQQAEGYIHSFDVRNEKLDLQTGVYCMDATASLLPYELELGGGEAVAEQSDAGEPTAANSGNGLKVTFYGNQDYAFRTPLYSTMISQDLSLFGKVFTNNKLHKDQAYYIKMTGFLYANVDRYVNFQLEADVYNAEVKINNQKVVNKVDTRGGVGLKAGYNPIEIVLSSSNAYDFRLLEKQKDGSFVPLSISRLYIKE